jgi:2-polyprenyl-6-methoxyphenol hydroxylase-like FAD-dependent oxidoreductase
MRRDFDAVIIGAGPAGSSAAILLARAGWSVALIEKQRFPRRKVCGECVAASNLPLLDALGVGDACIAAAGPELSDVALMRGADRVMAPLPAADSRHRWGRAIGRDVLDTLLLEQARSAGAIVFQPWFVQAIDGGPGDWHCQVRETSASALTLVRARVAIAAHGSWESLQSTRAVERPLRSPSDLFAFKANFRGAKLDAGLLPVLSFHGGYGGMVRGHDDLTTIACCIRSDRLDGARRMAAGAQAGVVVEALLRRECLGVRDALAGASREGAWLAAGPIRPGIRLRSDDRLFRVGNAAGEAHPIVGEGMSMALQSSWLLCALLVATGPAGGLADVKRQQAVASTYALQWQRHFQTRLWLAATFAQFAMRSGGAATLMAVARRWPGLLTAGARWSGKSRCAVDAEAIEAMAAFAKIQPWRKGAALRHGSFEFHPAREP